MVNWINGHTKGEFRCLVCHDGMFNTLGAYFATEELFFPEWEFNGTDNNEPHEPNKSFAHAHCPHAYMCAGTPWTNPETYNKWNPALHVHKWSTPTLVIHGGMDFRLPETEGLAAFTALQRRGIPSKLLLFPKENHWVLNSNNTYTSALSMHSSLHAHFLLCSA